MIRLRYRIGRALVRAGRRIGGEQAVRHELVEPILAEYADGEIFGWAIRETLFVGEHGPEIT